MVVVGHFLTFWVFKFLSFNFWTLRKWTLIYFLVYFSRCEASQLQKPCGPRAAVVFYLVELRLHHIIQLFLERIVRLGPAFQFRIPLQARNACGQQCTLQFFAWKYKHKIYSLGNDVSASKSAQTCRQNASSIKLFSDFPDAGDGSGLTLDFLEIWFLIFLPPARGGVGGAPQPRDFRKWQ